MLLSSSLYSEPPCFQYRSAPSSSVFSVGSAFQPFQAHKESVIMKAERISPDSSSDRVERVIQRGDFGGVYAFPAYRFSWGLQATLFSSLPSAAATGASAFSVSPRSAACHSQNFTSRTSEQDRAPQSLRESAKGL